MSNTDIPPSDKQTVILQPPQTIEPEAALDALQFGAIDLHGLMPWSSNYTFLGTVTHNDLKFNFVYKPCRGERPLWDFEQGTLCHREVAAYLVSRALNNQPAIPPTVLRTGPHGPGSMQQLIYADYNNHYFTIKNNAHYQTDFQQFAVFDYLVNNADRKGGHCLLDHRNKIWGIDHGLTFHTEYKLRTVIWEYAGQEIPAELFDMLKTFKASLIPDNSLYRDLQQHLSFAEITCFEQRLDNLLASRKFPRTSGMRDYPYPPI